MGIILSFAPMFFGNLNYIVIVIAALVGMALGYIWYSPFLFGPLWLKTKGWTDEHMKVKKNGQSMPRVFATMTLGTLVSAFILAGLYNSLVIVGFWGIVLVALSVWVGFVVPAKLIDYLFGGDSFVFFLLSIGHELIVIVIMALIIGIFG